MKKSVTPIVGLAAMLLGSVNVVAANSYVKDGIRFEPVLTEDFAGFAAGTEAMPTDDYVNNSDGEIPESYFQTPGWSGVGVYSAGGCAYIGPYADPEDDSTIYYGMLATPAFSNSGAVKVTMRARCSSSTSLNVQIADDSDTNTMDGWQFYINEEWQTIEMVTFFTGTDLRLYIYANSDEEDAYIDDFSVELISADGTPEALPAAIADDGSFTVNWKHDFEYYDVVGYTTHTAKRGETYTLMNADFSGIESEGTIHKPVQDEYGDMYPDLSSWSDFYGWTLKYPVYMNGGICLNGYWSEEGDYSAIISPTMNLSANGGKVSLRLTQKGVTTDPDRNERFNVMLLTLKNGQWTRGYAKGFDVTSDWETLDLELTGGGEQSVIQIIFGGYYVMGVRDLTVTQELSEGDEITLPLFVAESYFPGQGSLGWGNGEDEDDDYNRVARRTSMIDTSDTSEGVASITVKPYEQFIGDDYTYRLRGYRRITYLPDNSDPSTVTKWIGGDWSDYLKVTDADSGISHIQAAAEAQGEVYDLQGRRLQGEPTAPGLYLSKGKKFIRK